MKIIARIRNDFTDKFGLPRQSNLVEEITGWIVFEPEYRNAEALRGLEDYDYLWLLWEFSKAKRDTWSPTVRPPRLGGNTRMGVFATRSPFRPNPIGLSSVRLLGIEKTAQWGLVLRIGGADLLDGTPIYDIKPYLPNVDCHPEARGGFAAEVRDYHLEVEFPQELLESVPKEKRKILLGILAQDPRPSYQNDPERIYGFTFAKMEIRFQVTAGKLKVCEIKNE